MGKSVSTSLEDDEDLLKTETPGNTPFGSPPRKPPPFKHPPKPKLPVPAEPPLYRQSSQERPPLSIFKADPVMLISGYLRRLVSLRVIPEQIVSLCFAYYKIKLKSLMLDQAIPAKRQLVVQKIDDQSFEEIELGHDTSIVGKCPILKLSCNKNLKLDWNSLIKLDDTLKQNGTIVLTVFGDINLGKNTQLLCEGNGNIYIHCNNLILRTNAVISTASTRGYEANKPRVGRANTKADLKRYGNIYFSIKQSLVMDKMSNIRSGNITIECNQCKLATHATIKALRKDLNIRARNGIVSDDDLKDALYAKNEKHIENKNHLNGNENEIHEKIKQGMSYKLTMFEGDDEEFECCICWENEPNMMLKPCGHSTFCEACLQELNPVECPICRVIIQDRTKF